MHNLRVVIRIPAITVSIVTRSRVFFSGEFHDGKPDFFISIGDLRVLFRSLVNKVIHRSVQSIHAFGAVVVSHSIIHTTGGIQHHDNVQGLCIGGGGRRIGGQCRQRDQEIGAFVCGHRDGGLACQVTAEGDFVFLHRFVGPNTTCGGVVIALRILPRVKRVGVADGHRVGCSLSTPLPRCIRGDRNQHREQQRQHQQGGLQPYKFTKHSSHSIHQSFLFFAGISINKHKQGQAPIKRDTLYRTTQHVQYIA